METSEINIWRGRIERAEGLQASRHKMWSDALDLYNCEYYEKKLGTQLDRVDVHFANWYVDNLVPLVYFRDPYVFAKGRHSRYSGFAQTLETAINYYWRELNLKQEFKRVIKSGLLMPPGWLKLGYTAKIETDIAKKDEEEQKGLLQEIRQAITGVFKSKEEKLPEEKGVLNEYIKEDSIFCSWIPSWNILMPEGFQLVSQMPYLIEAEDLFMTDFLANPFYKNKEGIKSTREVNVSDTGNYITRVGYQNTSAASSDMAIIRLYHVWDRRNQRRFTMSMRSNNAHFEGAWPYDMEGFPYKPLIFDESLPDKDKSNPYPVNVLQPILPQLIEQSQARTQMVRHRRRSAAIILAQKGLLTEEDMNQLEESDAIQLCLVSNIGAFQMTQTPPLPPDVFKIDDIIKQDLQMGTNMGQMMFQAQAGQRTATQAQIGQSGLQLKASARVDVVEDYTVSIAKSIAQLLWQFYDRERIAEIIGEEVTRDMWPDLPDDPKERRRIVQSELQFRIDAGSTAPPKDETIDRKQLLDYASIVAAIAPERIKKDEFIKELTKKFKFVQDVDKIVLSNDDEEIQAANAENELMAKGAPQVVSPNENHTIHVGIHSQAPPNELIDEHIAQHGEYLGVQQGENKSGVGNTPQEGDMRPPTKSAAPEITRQGIMNQGDIYQEAQNLGIGMGAEAM